MRLIMTTFVGFLIGFLIGISFPSVNITKLHFPSSIASYNEDKNSGIKTQALLNHAWISTHKNNSLLNSTSISKIYISTNPKGAERLAPEIIVPESDFYLRRLWGNPSEMASGGGDEPPRRSLTSHVYRKTKLLIRGRGGGREDSSTPPPSATPQIVSSTFPSSSQQAAVPFPTTPGLYYYAGPPPSTQQHTGASTSQPPPDASPTDEADSRMLIAPDGDTFYPSSQPTHKVRDIIRSRFDAPYISWKKIPLNVRDMWFREFEKDFKWLPQHHDKVRKSFEKRGSTRLRDMFTDIRKKGERPLWIGEDVWADLCASWGTPEYIQKRAQNKGNRASDSAGMGTSLHTGGSIPHAEHRRRLEKSLGRQPTVVEVHTRTHQRQETQEWITPKAQKAYEDYMQLSQIQSSGGEGSSSTASCRRSDYELWTEAVGGIQKGRIYGLGSEAGSYRSHSYTPTDVDMEERLRTRLREEIRAEVRADITAEVDSRFAQINENIRAGFERMSREMHDRREPPTEQPDEETESDRDA